MDLHWAFPKTGGPKLDSPGTVEGHGRGRHGALETAPGRFQPRSPWPACLRAQISNASVSECACLPRRSKIASFVAPVSVAFHPGYLIPPMQPFGGHNQKIRAKNAFHERIMRFVVVITAIKTCVMCALYA